MYTTPVSETTTHCADTFSHAQPLNMSAPMLPERSLQLAPSCDLARAPVAEVAIKLLLPPTKLFQFCVGTPFPTVQELESTDLNPLPLPNNAVTFVLPTLLEAPNKYSPLNEIDAVELLYGGSLKDILGSIKYFVDGSNSSSILNPPKKCWKPGVLSNSFLTVQVFVTSSNASMIPYCPLPVPSQI